MDRWSSFLPHFISHTLSSVLIFSLRSCFFLLLRPSSLNVCQSFIPRALCGDHDEGLFTVLCFLVYMCVSLSLALSVSRT